MTQDQADGIEYEEDPVEEYDYAEEEVLEEEEVEQSEEPVAEYYNLFGDDFVPPKFDDMETELDWYKNKYPAMAQFYQSTEFLEGIATSYEESLMKKEEQIAELKATSAALKGDPSMFIKMYYPEMAAANGIDPRMSRKDATTYVDSVLVQEFGDRYQDKYDMDEAYDPKSLSGQIAQRHRELISEVHQHNKSAEDLVKQHAPRSAEELQAIYNDEYEKHMKDYLTKEEYSDFVKKAENYRHNVKDVYHMMHFDGFMQNAYQQGIEAGKKEANKQMLKQGNRAVPRPQMPQQKQNGKPIQVWDLYK